MLLKYSVKCYSAINGKRLHSSFVWANNIEQACLLEGKELNTTEKAIIESCYRSEGKYFCSFRKVYKTELPENLIQDVFIEEVLFCA
jgi:hypothetical protein